MYKLVAKSHNLNDDICEGIFAHYHNLSSEPIDYIIDCVHGGEDGVLIFRWNKKDYYLLPKEVRKFIKKLTGINISKNTKISFIPCYPARVSKRYSHGLSYQNIDIIGDWEESTFVQLYSFSNDPERVEIHVYPKSGTELITLK